jgi:DNA polymerase III epsilon subunit-like protein
MKTVLLFDTETTGLTLHPDADLAKQPRMIEFGGILLDAGRRIVIEEISILINPGELITEEITKITGITNDDVKDAPSFAERLPAFRRVFAEADMVVAHNLPFDKAIVMGELKRLNVRDFQWPRQELCTVGVFTEEWGRNPKMTELYQRIMGKPLEQTHRALDDVRALLEIFLASDLAELVE